MSIALGYLFVLAWGLWVGAIVFFSFVAAPTAFRSLELENAGKYIRTLFPRYYLFGIFCGLIALGSGGALIALKFWPLKLGTTALVLIAGMLVVAIWARQRLLPRMNDLRDEAYQARVTAQPNEEAELILSRWQRLHRLSVMLNTLVFIMGLLAGAVSLNCWLIFPGKY